MKYLPHVAVFLLMLSLGMSLKREQIIDNWSRLTPLIWAKLMLATFIIPPAIAVALGHLLSLSFETRAGLILIAIAPGAPLMTRSVDQKGFDMQMAASYQVWGALLTPLMIPLLVYVIAKSYDREIWVPPPQLLEVVIKQQFLPLGIGIALMAFAPKFSTKIRRGLNMIGNVLLVVFIVAMLIKIGSTLETLNFGVVAAAFLLAIGCLAGSRLLLRRNDMEIKTLAISNVNRHVGLALLISGSSLHDQRTLPTIVTYAVAAILVMIVYTRMVKPGPSLPSTAQIPEA